MVERYTAAARAHLDRITAAGDPALALSPVVAADMYRLATALAEHDDLDGRFVLGWLHYYRYLALPEGQDQDDLGAAVQALATCFVFGPEPLPEPLLPLVAQAALPLVSAVYEHAMADPGPAAIDAAVGLTLRVVDVLPADHPQWIRFLVGLGLALGERFARTGAPEDLDAAIDTHQQAVDGTPAGHHDRPRYLTYLGLALRDRYTRDRDDQDLDATIRAHREAAGSAGLDGEDRAGYLDNLASALHARYERTGVPGDLDVAVSAFRRVLDATPAGHPRRGWRLYNLAVALTQRADRTGAADLDGAIVAYRQALDAAGPDERLRAQAVNNLGIVLRTRFDRHRDPHDLDAAVRHGRDAVAAANAGPADGAALTNLGVALKQRYEHGGGAQDINEAVEVSRQAVDATPPAHPDRGAVLNNLGLALLARYQRTGAVDDLDAAVDRFQESADATPPDQVAHSHRLGNLTDALRVRFERTESLPDLDRAIEAGRAAVDAAPPGHPGRASALTTLGALFQRRFDRSDTLADLDLAVDLARQALDAEPAKPRYLSHLANALRLRSQLTGSATDAADAVSAIRLAVDVAPAGDPNLPLYLSALGLALRQRFRTIGGDADLDAAIAVTRQAAGTQPADSPDRAGYLLNLGDMLRERFAATGTGAAEAVDVLAEVAYGAGATPAVRVDAARVAASLAAADGRRELAADLLERAVDELPFLTPRTLRRADQEFVLSRFGGMASDAAALVLSGATGGPGDQARAERAFRLLEAGRATLLGQALDARRTAGGATSPDEADPGPIVVFNVSRYGSDALLLTTAGLAHLPLPGLDARSVVEQSYELRQALHDAVSTDAGWQERAAAQDRISGVLEWLWDVAAGPVLDALRVPASGASPRRVWFVPGGMLSVLPLHAAGHHRPSAEGLSGRTVLDRVIVSYTPTVRALHHARRRPAAPAATAHALVVAMPTTPDGAPLPNAAEETAVLRDRLPGAVALVEPLRAEVLTGLAGCRIAHFACHGTSNPFDPARSALLLRDHAAGPLTVADLVALDLRDAGLAYLSACETALTPVLHLGEVEITGGAPPGTGGLADLIRAANRSRGLIDESIHLGSAFQLAGFRHVVGTLWEINDRIAVDVARAFYAGLAGEQDRPDPARSAGSLRQAVLAVRDRFPRTPTLWAAFLHSGA
ncbi:CHAT domain-containing protein [Dactylosporangium fulvum]|uniref:CHAT domain-containing protein n=1 Tax=Dactylosporangium fulvum TaxID=53359 RepID=A0ABY5VPR0_9ACTN|nr:CHAT domain-containing protein [Dactylosporangium fulvum]UWP79160.1 CHAT domain-containing protein [Dactylosporangium fulvum]